MIRYFEGRGKESNEYSSKYLARIAAGSMERYV
jgi:hypothetical protein